MLSYFVIRSFMEFQAAAGTIQPSSNDTHCV